MEGGLEEEESFAVAVALADMGVKVPADLSDVGDDDARQAAKTAGLKQLRANRLVKIIASMSVAVSPKPSHEPKVEEPSPVALHLINDFDMNAQVSAPL